MNAPARTTHVHAVNAIGTRLISPTGHGDLAEREVILDLLRESSQKVAGHKFSQHFLTRNGEKLLTLGSWIAGRRIAMSRAWVGRPALGTTARHPLVHSNLVRVGLAARSLITWRECQRLYGYHCEQESTF